jgi:deazaflavin-dependent oxidoreductase (nitroreductase family)
MTKAGGVMVRGMLRTLVWLYRRSGGRIGGRMFGGPILLLTTTGRRSGRTWTVPLLYQPDGDRWVIIASNGGSPRHPAWWLNLRAQPQATIQVGRETHAVTATAATGAERERLWQLMTAMFKGYDGYVRKTTRRIPVVVLQRR